MSERLDDLQNNGLMLFQDPARFCFGADAVCLTDFAAVKKGETMMDLCTGTGVIPILLSAKTDGAFFTGLELQPETAETARRSVAYNRLEHRVRIDTGDIKQAPGRYGPGAFNVVTVNPPYLKNSTANHNNAVSLARHEIACTLADVAAVSAKILTPAGRLYIVHRPERLAEVLCVLRTHHLEPKRLQLVQSGPDKPPAFFLTEAAMYGREGMRVLPTLFI